MERRALTAPPVVPLILAAIVLTSRLRAPRPLTIVTIRRKGVRTPRPLVLIQLPIGAIPHRAARIPRLSVAIPHRAARIPRLSVATPHRAARIPRLSVATPHPAVRIPRPSAATLRPAARIPPHNVATLHPAVPTLRRVGLTLHLAAVTVAEAVIAVAAGHRAAGVAVGLIDRNFNPFCQWPASLQEGGPLSLCTPRRQS